MNAMSLAPWRSCCRSSVLPARAAAFFTLFYLYVWLWVDPALLYFWPSPAFPPFLAGRSFLAGFLGRPGGLADYAAAALSQFYYYAWAGALIITAVAGLLCLAAWMLHTILSSRAPRFVHYVPAVMVAVAYGRYAHILAPALALLTAVLLACVYALLPVRSGPARLTIFLALSAPLYYAAGGTYVAYAALCGAFELVAGRRVVLAVVYAACATLVPYAAGTHIFQVRPSAAFAHLWLLPEAPDAVSASIPLALAAFFLLAAFGAGAWGRLRPLGARAGGDDGGEPPGTGAASGWRRSGALPGTCGLLVLAAALVYASFNWPARTVRLVEYYASRRAWPQVLERARKVPADRYGVLMNMTVNWALYHLGRLPSDQFAYRQGPFGLVRYPSEFWPEGTEQAQVPTPLEFMRDSDILLELGRVSEAEHMATEALEDQGYRPWVLEALATVKIIKGEPEAARTFLNALSKDLIRGGWAKERLRQVQADPVLFADLEVQRIRALMIARDDVAAPPLETVLTELLERDSRNRMAFEYLMAHYLLTGNLEGVASNVHRLGQMGYAGIPRHYEEAVLLYTQLTGKALDLGGLAISAGTRKGFQSFNEALARAGGDRQAALRAVAPEYRDSYLPYYVFFLGAEPAK